ncbi:isopenicillin N synthase family oxygenase [Pseudooceanicola sediminis]|uniref:Isopenicillin N synthase family oxygenase n=1 Tax=Pseudooceanicola sediminis TaxID=2211117 RepID=A0A399J3F8_9RHOB|nr:isopenicillin N synthase family oxygenase [Puniceibacterium sp. HSS470]RII39800.1 isopenicillin N synthase family oxygenase [Pseudooceanicola sediminis]
MSLRFNFVRHAVGNRFFSGQAENNTSLTALDRFCIQYANKRCSVKGEFDNIPIVDLSGLANEASDTARAASVAALKAALETSGFAYLSNHGVPEDLVERMRQMNMAVHALPDVEKEKLKINDFHRGYMPMSTSTIVTSSVAKVTKPNQSESLMVMHEVPEGAPHAGEPLQGPNQFPESLPQVRETALAYMAEMTKLGERIAGGLAEALGLPRDWFEQHFQDPTLFLRLLHYPEQKDEEELFGSAPHTDYGFVTLLKQDNVGGLEVRNKRGEWIPAPPIENTFVMNVGDILAKWSNGRFVSTPHRVKNLSRRDRYSQPFFYDPSMRALVECPPAMLDAGEKPQMKPVLYGDYLLERLNKNYDYRKKTS